MVVICHRRRNSSSKSSSSSTSSSGGGGNGSGDTNEGKIYKMIGLRNVFTCPNASNIDEQR